MRRLPPAGADPWPLPVVKPLRGQAPGRSRWCPSCSPHTRGLGAAGIIKMDAEGVKNALSAPGAAPPLNSGQNLGFQFAPRSASLGGQKKYEISPTAGRRGAFRPFRTGRLLQGAGGRGRRRPAAPPPSSSAARRDAGGARRRGIPCRARPRRVGRRSPGLRARQRDGELRPVLGAQDRNHGDLRRRAPRPRAPGGAQPGDGRDRWRHLALRGAGRLAEDREGIRRGAKERSRSAARRSRT